MFLAAQSRSGFNTACQVLQSVSSLWKVRVCVCVCGGGVIKTTFFSIALELNLMSIFNITTVTFMIQNLAVYIWRIRNGMPRNVISFAKVLQSIPPINYSRLNVYEGILTVHYDLWHYTGTCHPGSSYTRSSYARMQSVQLGLFLYKHQ